MVVIPEGPTVAGNRINHFGVNAILSQCRDAVMPQVIESQAR